MRVNQFVRLNRPNPIARNPAATSPPVAPSPQEPQDIGPVKKFSHFVVGVAGSVVGGCLGLAPGIAYAIDRSLNSERDDFTGKLILRRHRDLFSQSWRAHLSWEISYSVLGGVASAVAARAVFGPGLATASLALLGATTGHTLQKLFRSAGEHSFRDCGEIGSSPLTYCSDKMLASSEINNLWDGARAGVREGAYLGKLAFQDLAFPSMRADQRTPYRE